MFCSCDYGSLLSTHSNSGYYNVLRLAAMIVLQRLTHHDPLLAGNANLGQDEHEDEQSHEADELVHQEI